MSRLRPGPLRGLDELQTLDPGYQDPPLPGLTRGQLGSLSMEQERLAAGLQGGVGVTVALGARHLCPSS